MVPRYLGNASCDDERALQRMVSRHITLGHSSGLVRVVMLASTKRNKISMYPGRLYNGSCAINLFHLCTGDLIEHN